MRHRTLKISTAPRRTSPTWTNKTTDKQALIEQLCTPLQINHTVDEYHNLPKSEKDQAKDVGGYVGGHLKDGLRRKGHTYTRSFITLDLDEAPHNLPTHLENTWDHAWFATTTASHTPEKPRWRIIIWLNRDITSDEYAAISRKLAEQINPELNWVDPTTFEPERFMYWSATCTDAEFLTATSPKTAHDLDPQTILATYDNWSDLTTWPGVTAEEAKRHEHAGTKVEDPRTKTGIIGAFNRTYNIETAIKEFLPETYVPGTTKNRYTYTGGSSSNGLIIYDSGLHAYSQHATDPASEQMVNAFDLVRIHKFGHLDTEAKPGTPINRMPSATAMTGLALNDHATKLENASATAQKIYEVFQPIPGTPEAAPAPKTPQEENPETNDHNPDQEQPQENHDWLATLETKQNGTFQDSLHNFETIFTHDPRYKNIAWNAHSERLENRDPQHLPWKQLKPGWTDNDTAQLKTTIAASYQGLYAPTKMHDALTSVAAQRSFHPVRDYFNTLPQWDGIPRLDTLLIDYLGAADTEYTRAVTRKTLIAAIRRTFNPGTKFDTVLVLVGPQGAGKSTIFAKLAGQWFSDSLTISDMKDKDGAEKLAGVLIMEIAELTGMRKTDAETLKSFLSRTDDKYRPAYARTVESHPRQGIIVGTTNAKEGFLRDPTGGRRFWPVETTGTGIAQAWNIPPEEINQIWAETKTYENKGEPLHLTGDLAQAANQRQTESVETDDRIGLVQNYLEKTIPTAWDHIDLYARRHYLDSGTMPGGTAFDTDSWNSVGQRTQVSKIEVWSECFGRAPEDMKKADSHEISTIMAQLSGWEDTGARATLHIYGRQRIYQKIDAIVRTDQVS